jgi:hypothetical protein
MDFMADNRYFVLFYDPKEDEPWFPFRLFYPDIVIEKSPAVQKILLWNKNIPYVALSYIKYCEGDRGDNTQMLEDIHKAIRKASEDA